MLFTYLIVAVGAMVAGFAQGISGFAFGLIAMSIWAWVLDPHLAAILSICGALTGQLLAAITIRRGFYWTFLLPFVLGGLVGIPIGVSVLPYLDIHLFKALLGAFLIVWCPIMLLAKYFPTIAIGNRFWDGIIGIIGGIMSGIAGFAGAVPSLWSMFRGFDKHIQRTVVQNFNLSTLLVTFLTYLAKGAITVEVLPFLAMVVPIVIITAFLGARMYIGLSEVRFKQIILTILSISGLLLLASAIPEFIS